MLLSPAWVALQEGRQSQPLAPSPSPSLSLPKGDYSKRTVFTHPTPNGVSQQKVAGGVLPQVGDARYHCRDAGGAVQHSCSLVSKQAQSDCDTQSVTSSQAMGVSAVSSLHVLCS